MGCGISTVKYLLFIFNLIFALSGLALLVLGILIKTETKLYDHFLDSKFDAPPILLIVIGSIVFLVAFYGCCGAIRESHCMIITFAVLLITIFIIEVVAASLAFVYSNDIGDIFNKELEKSTHQYYTDESSKEMMDTIQEALKCCGYLGPKDYKIPILPASCCVNHKHECNYVDDSKIHYTTNCPDALKTFIHKSGVTLGAVAICVGAVAFAGIIFALCLANSIKNKERRRHHV